MVLTILQHRLAGCRSSAAASASPAAAAVTACLARTMRTPYRASSIAYSEPSSSGSPSRPANREHGSHEFCTTTGQPSTSRTRRTVTAAADCPSSRALRTAGGGCSTAALISLVWTSRPCLRISSVKLSSSSALLVGRLGRERTQALAADHGSPRSPEPRPPGGSSCARRRIWPRIRSRTAAALLDGPFAGIDPGPQIVTNGDVSGAAHRFLPGGSRRRAAAKREDPIILTVEYPTASLASK